MLAGRDDDKAVSLLSDELARAQMIAPSSAQAEEGPGLEEFIEGQLIPIPVQDGNCPETTVHGPRTPGGGRFGSMKTNRC